jgi:hypothetical protein
MYEDLMNDITFIYVSSPAPAVGVGGVGVGVTCFLGHQQVLMDTGEWKRIDNVEPGESVRGRWQDNSVRGVEKPLLENRPMYLINGAMWNTGDHPMWTDKGWAVIDKAYYQRNDWECVCTIHGENGETWQERYTPCHPDKIHQVSPDLRLAVTDGEFTDVRKISIDTSFSADTQLYSLALDGDRTMYVDGYCVSGWANEKKYDYDARIGT